MYDEQIGKYVRMYLSLISEVDISKLDQDDLMNWLGYVIDIARNLIPVQKELDEDHTRLFHHVSSQISESIDYLVIPEDCDIQTRKNLAKLCIAAAETLRLMSVEERNKAETDTWMEEGFKRMRENCPEYFLDEETT